MCAHACFALESVFECELTRFPPSGMASFLKIRCIVRAVCTVKLCLIWSSLISSRLCVGWFVLVMVFWNPGTGTGKLGQDQRRQGKRGSMGGTWAASFQISSPTGAPERGWWHQKSLAGTQCWVCRAQGQAAGWWFILCIRAPWRIYYCAPVKPKYSFFVLSIFVAPGSTNIHFSCSREHKYSVWLVIYNICVRGIFIHIYIYECFILCFY